MTLKTYEVVSRRKALGSRSLATLVLASAAAIGLAGCKNKRDTEHPEAAAQQTQRVMAEPGAYEGIYIDDAYAYEEPPAEAPQGAVGYETLSDDTKVVVVQYVHTYPEPLDTFPRVYWSGRWYYNVHGDFVYYSDWYGGWVYYYGPPAPLVAYWNSYYPWAPYYWGMGYYGAGWYWGGVGVYGYHAYGLPVVHHHHHHHHHYDKDRAPTARPTKPPHSGQPATDPSPGAPGKQPPRRNAPDDKVARRTPPSNADAPRRTPPSKGDAAPARTRPNSLQAGAAPTRAKPQRTAPVRGVPTRVSPGTRELGSVARTPPSRRGSSYTTGSGQRVTRIDPGAPTRTAPSRTAPEASRSVGSLPAQNVAPRRPSTDGGRTVPEWGAKPSSQPAPSRMPSWGATHAPERGSAGPVKTNRGYSSPTRSGGSRSAVPSRTPSRSSAPSRPTRSYSPPSRSAPSRSAPSRSAPSRSAPSRSAPSRSAPSRSAPSRSAPSRSAPSRSPSRSSRSSRSSSRSSSGSRSTSSRSSRSSSRRSAPSRSSRGRSVRSR